MRMKLAGKSIVIMSLLVGAFLIPHQGCSGGSLWSPSEGGGVPSPGGGLALDRAEEDFENGANWTGADSRPDLWTLSVPQDRPQGDDHVLTNTDIVVQPHLAIWNDAELSSNPGSQFSVLAKAAGDANWMGVVFNCQPDGSFYLFRVHPGTSQWEIQRVSPSGTLHIAGGTAQEDGNLIVPGEYLNLIIGWSAYQHDLLEASIVSPTTGVHKLASVSIASPLAGGKVGVYSMVGFVRFDDARLTGDVRINMRPSITVRADHLTGTIPRRVFGVNLVWRGDVNGIPKTTYDEQEYESEVANWFRLLNTIYPIGLSSTRYPGGLEALMYFWGHGIGPISSRGNPNDSDTLTLGTDEFLRFTEELGADAVITLNPTFPYLPVGDPAVAQYAADWIEYCNAPDDGSNPGGGIDFAALRAFNGHKAPYGVRYWEIGNEIGGLETSDLGKIINSFSDPIKKIDPTVMLGFQDHTVSEPYSQNPFSPDAKNYYTNSQNDGILDLAAEAFDFWEPHPYGPAILEIGPALFQNGGALTISHYFSAPGNYQFTLRGYCLNPTTQPVRSHQYGTLNVMLNGSSVWEFEVASQSERDWTQDVTIPKTGTYTITIQGDNLIQNRIVYLTNELKVKDPVTEEVTVVNLTNSDQVYGIMMATAPHVDYAYYDLFKDFYGGKPLYPTEWNTTTGFYDAPNDLKWALSNADFLNVFLRNGTFLSNFWDLTSDQLLVGLVQGVQGDSPTPRLRPTAYVFQLYKSLLKGDRTEVDAQSPFYLRGIDGVSLGSVGSELNLRIPYISSIASLSSSKDTLSLVVINKHRDMPIPIDVSLQGFASSGRGNVSVINADTIDANNEPDNCPDPGDCVKAVTSAWDGASSKFTYAFPPHSVTALVFHKNAAESGPPAPPSNLSSEVTGESVKLQWSASQSSGVVGYYIYRSRWADGPYGNRINAVPLQSTEYIDENLDPAATLYYAVVAVDGNDNESVFSNKIVAHIPGNAPIAYYPATGEILSGFPSGSIDALTRGDYSVSNPLEGNSFYRVRSVGGSTDVVLKVNVSQDPSVFSGLAVYFQALYSGSGSHEFSLWNTATNQWDAVRTMPVHANQIERYMEAFPDSEFVHEHISGAGEIQLRIAAHLGGQFTSYLDYCAIMVK